MTLLVDVAVPGAIWWALKHDDPDSYPITALPKFSLVSPCLEEPGPPSKACGEPIGWVDDELIFVAFGFQLLYAGDLSMQELLLLELNDRPVTWYLRRMLAGLYQASRQYNISSEIHQTSVVELSQSMIRRFPTADPVASGSFVATIVSTALRSEHIPMADRYIAGAPPVWETMLLDGLRQLVNGEHRTAILHCTLALETALRERAETGWAPDPVLARLVATAHFKNFLHEVSLYTLGKSLLENDKSLYDRAQGLYQTRNKIVHKGVLPANAQHLLPISFDGAHEAYEIAKEVLVWMGFPHGFPELDWARQVSYRAVSAETARYYGGGPGHRYHERLAE